VGKGISYSREEGVTTPEERQAQRDAVAKMPAEAQVELAKNATQD
jgi:hypothetical protein